MKKLLTLLIPALLLSACNSPKLLEDYQKDISGIDPVLLEEAEDDLEVYTALIDNFSAVKKAHDDALIESESTDEAEAAVKKLIEDLIKKQTQNVDFEVKTENHPPAAWYIEKARAQNRLGMVNEAILTLNEALDIYRRSSIAWNNLAKIYDDAGECKEAEKYYRLVIEEFALPQYYLDIAMCYYDLDDNSKHLETIAEAYINHLANFPSATDPELEEFINENLNDQ